MTVSKLTLRLDETVLTALNLIEKGDNPPPNSSLQSILDKCTTKQGSRLLLEWIKKPTTDCNEIIKRQSIVESLVENIEFRQEMMNKHLKIPDLNSILKKLSTGKGQLKECVLLHDFTLKVFEFSRELSEFVASGNIGSDLFREYSEQLKESCRKLSKFKEMIEVTVDLDACEKHEYVIKPDFDDELKGLRELMDECEKEIGKATEELSEILDLPLEKKLKLEKNSQYGYHLRVSRLDSNQLKLLSKGSAHSVIELSTQKAGVLFTTKSFKELSERYEGAREAYSEKQKELVAEIIEISKSYQALFESLDIVYCYLDVLVSFAYVASVLNYSKPNIFPIGSGNLVLEDSRHPCLELQEGVEFIKNDVFMDRKESYFQIITGSNMGGKSTYIRQVGMIVVMVQIGSFVPCKRADVPIFDSILCRVGAGDKPLKGISTFMAEMMDTSTVLESATENSLVLIDELGRGTSTFDGFGLAWAIAFELASKIKCFTLFTTHFHELTYLSDEVSGVKNFHVSTIIKDNELILLYKVEEGRNDQSFGIHVARMAQFPEEVILLAKAKVEELNEECMLEKDSSVDDFMNNLSNMDLGQWKLNPYSNENDLMLAKKLKSLIK